MTLPPSRLARLALTALVLLAFAGPAAALTLTDRTVAVQGTLDISAATKVADKLVKLDAASDAPIFLMITATQGTAQGVMIVADTVRSLTSPVVGVVPTEIHGAGAALAPLTDRVVLYPSAGLILTELDYEGVKKPEPKPEADAATAADADAGKPPAPKPPAAKAPSKRTLLLQRARERFLDRLYGRLAKRVHMDKAALTAAIDDGGLLLTAEDAVRRKIAHSVVDRLSYVKLPVEKREVKITTTDKKVEVAPKPVLERGGDG